MNIPLPLTESCAVNVLLDSSAFTKRPSGCQANASRWDAEQWLSFVNFLDNKGSYFYEGRADSSVFISDAGGLAHGMPHGVVRPFSFDDVSEVLKAARIYEVPVTVMGGRLTAEGEAIAFGVRAAQPRGRQRREIT